MKTTLAALILCLFTTVAQARHFDLWKTITLERYTLIDDDSYRYETGHLLHNGKFQVISSDVMYYNYYSLSSDDIAIFSGKPLMDLPSYDIYKSNRLLPWKRSEAVFTFDLTDYVIVGLRNSDVNPTITIVDQPESARLLSGYSTYFSVEAEPESYLSYQWYFNNKPIPGETSSYLFMFYVTPKQAGRYKVALSTGGKPVMSKSVLLQVITPASVKKGPKTQTVKEGKNAVFRATAAGTGPFTYQWYYAPNGTYAPIAKATKSFYTVSHAKPTDAGLYAVEISNGLSSASAEATLTVEPRN